MKSKPTNPFKELDKLFKLTEEPMEKEWFTPKKYSDHSGISYSSVTDMLRKQLKAKKVECWIGYSKTNCKRIMKYRFIENKPAKG